MVNANFPKTNLINAHFWVKYIKLIHTKVTRFCKCKLALKPSLHLSHCMIQAQEFEDLPLQCLREWQNLIFLHLVHLFCLQPKAILKIIPFCVMTNQHTNIHFRAAFINLNAVMVEIKSCIRIYNQGTFSCKQDSPFQCNIINLYFPGLNVKLQSKS